jgi:hypothetical protein
MDIHKPKPVQNWREFLAEITVIVCGVLIALALEQAVESLHWHHAVHLGRESLHREMQFDNKFYAWRVALAPCATKRIADVSDLIEKAAAEGQIGHLQQVSLLIGQRMEDSEWQSERASQTLTHFPREELALLGTYYAQTSDFREWIFQENAAWTALRILENGPKPLHDTDITALRLNLESVRRLGDLIATNAGRQLELSRQAGVTPQAVASDVLSASCTPIDVVKSQ